jgi:hypothetical protein
MTEQDLFETAMELKKKINQASSAKRLALQPEFSRALERLTADGQEVPPQLRQVNANLCDEAIEAWFDNMPV